MTAHIRSPVGAVATGLAFLLAAPAPAFAHNHMVDSTPEKHSEGSLQEFSATTNEALFDASGAASGFALKVRGRGGEYFGEGCLKVEDATLSTAAAFGAAGEYTHRLVGVLRRRAPDRRGIRVPWEPPATFEPAPPLRRLRPAATPGPRTEPPLRKNPTHPQAREAP